MRGMSLIGLALGGTRVKPHSPHSLIVRIVFPRGSCGIMRLRHVFILVNLQLSSNLPNNNILYPPEGNAYLTFVNYTDFVAHLRHLYIGHSTIPLFTSHRALCAVVVGGREARTRPSLGEQSRMLLFSWALSKPLSSCMRAYPSDVAFAGAAALPYTLPSQSSTSTTRATLGMRASSRMVYLSSRAGCSCDDS